MISAILQYSTIDYKFLKCNLDQLSKFCDEIIVPICTHFFNGQPEDPIKLQQSKDIISSYPIARVLEFKWDDPTQTARYYHNLSRKLGTDAAKNNWVLFIDTDEILSDEFGPWFETIKDSDNSYWFTCYWYFRSPKNQATRLESAGLLTKKQYCNWDINPEKERQQLFDTLPNFHNGDLMPIVSLSGVPMMHHFSWVRTKEEMLTKVKNWGHSLERNWVELIEEEFSRPFNGTDFVHGYDYNIVDDTFNIMNYSLFILGYGSSKFLDAWIDISSFPNTNIRIIDNGQQQYSDRLTPYIYHVTSQNLGCAGGWNLICKIAFDKLGLEKVIISNEDNLYTEEYIEALYEQCTPTNIAGTYDRAFEFSLFCIHKDTYKKVGMFDENVIKAAAEDTDYKYRCDIHGITVSTLNISADYNASETGGDTIPDIRDENVQYVATKWDNYTSNMAHNDQKYTNNPELFISPRLKEMYNTTTFPSLTEFEKFITKTIK